MTSDSKQIRHHQMKESVAARQETYIKKMKDTLLQNNPFKLRHPRDVHGEIESKLFILLQNQLYQTMNKMTYCRLNNIVKKISLTLLKSVLLVQNICGGKCQRSKSQVGLLHVEKKSNQVAAAVL